MFFLVLLGTGILRPFTDLKEYNSFDTGEDQEGNQINIQMKK